jgi:hypothetical protein
MKRDWDLIRLLLLDLEGEQEVDLSAYTEDEREYHRYLIADAGLAEGTPTTTLGKAHPTAYLFWLNWQGHDFLEAARNDSIWEKAKAKLAGMGGSAGFEVVKALLIATAKEQLGL